MTAFRNAFLVYLNYEVSQGPFARMKYIRASNGSVLVPKIAGTYECELHGLLNVTNLKNYDTVIDIGCAEGYYAVGFAFLNRSNPGFKVYAYDIDTDALANAKRLSALNNVEDKIVFDKWFDARKLKDIDSVRGLIICDIEGGEEALLNHQNCPELLNYDILVEVHDGATGQIRDVLHQRFEKTHSIQHISYEKEHPFRVNYLPWIKNRKFVRNVLDEGRRYGLDWLYLKKYML